MILGSTPMFASPGSSFLEFLNSWLTVYWKMQYDVQNDRPHCEYSRKFQTLVTSTVQSPSHLHNGSQRSPARWHLQFPLQATKRPKWSNTEHTLLASGRLVHYGTHAFVLSFHSQSHSLGFGMLDALDRVYYSQSCDRQCSLCVLEQRMLGCWDEFRRPEANSKHQLSCFIDRSWSTVFAVNTPDAPCAMSLVWGWLSPGWRQRRCQWPQETSSMHSMLSFCQFQTSPSYITFCEWMEEKCLAAMRSHLLRDVMNWNFWKYLPWPKSNPPLWQFWLMKVIDGKNYHIRVHCPEAGLSVGTILGKALVWLWSVESFVYQLLLDGRETRLLHQLLLSTRSAFVVRRW